MKSNQVSIRLAEIADIPVLVSLMHDFYAESDYPLDHEWATKAFGTLLSNSTLGRVWVAVVDEIYVGYAVLSVRYAMEFGGMSAYIDDLYIRPASRRQRIATALLDALVAYCDSEGYKSLHVEVGIRNLPARVLYGQYGLQPGSSDKMMLTVTLPIIGA